MPHVSVSTVLLDPKLLEEELAREEAEFFEEEEDLAFFMELEEEREKELLDLVRGGLV